MTKIHIAFLQCEYSNAGTSFGYEARFKGRLVEVLVHEMDGPRFAMT
jgi:hypothetical protein